MIWNKNVVNNTIAYANQNGFGSSRAENDEIMYIKEVYKKGNFIVFVSNDGDKWGKAELLQGLSAREKAHLNNIQKVLL